MGKTHLVQKAFNEGKTDLKAIAEETGAALGTVRVQWSKFKKRAA
jgi:hypothetical protein